MTEQEYEKLLNIKTSGEQKQFNESFHYNIYEPTSYHTLDTIFKNYNITSNDSIVDFGCGKGRLNFYLNYHYDATVTGIEMNKFFYEEALSNKTTFLKSHIKNNDKINFLNCYAEKYKIQPNDTKFYFFNPFSVQIFIKIVDNILFSMEEHPRTVDIILYYPLEDYIYFLENNTYFQLIKEIKIPGKYEKNVNHRCLIYRLSYE